MTTARPTRILIAAGGTGGHVLPAIAVIEELRRRNTPHELLWVGGAKGVERELATANIVPFVAIPFGKLRRYFSLENAIDAIKVPIGIVAGARQVRRFRPDVIFSTGGAVSVPTLVWGHRYAPVLTHEQTAQIGMANRTAARYAATFAVGYEEAALLARNFAKHVIFTGNPVRSSLGVGDAARGRQHFGFTDDLPMIYVTGGARGATPVSERILALLPALLERAQILHQAGPASANDDVARLRQAQANWPAELQRRYVVTDFVGDELADVYAMTDLVIGRAGAGTIADLAFAGLPSILIPLPGTRGDEQTKNANVIARVGGAVILPQTEATPERLRTEITALLNDDTRRAAMGNAARALSRPDAPSLLVDELLRLAQQVT